jgi:hypothetical protein
MRVSQPSWSLCLLLTSILCGGCNSTANQQPTTSLPPSNQRGYILSSEFDLEKNALTIVNTETWQIAKQTPLPRIPSRHFSQDPEGRIWIGFTSAIGQAGVRLIQIYSPDGDLIKEIKNACVDIEGEVLFAEGRAFIPCSENGFTGKVTVVDQKSFDVVKEIKTGIPESFSSITMGSALLDNHMLIPMSAGPKDQPDDGVLQAGIALIDTKSMQVTTQRYLGRYTYIDHALPHNGLFYLFNQGASSTKGQSPRPMLDVIAIDPKTGKPAPAVKGIDLGYGAKFGTFDGDTLYTFNNSMIDLRFMTGDKGLKRSVSRINLKTNAIKTWDMPDQMEANDIKVHNGRILLTRWTAKNDYKDDGIYELNPTDGQIKLLLNIPNAERMILPASTQLAPATP